MSYAQNTGTVFDLFTPLFKEIFKSPYINLGYWDKTTQTIAQAQEKLVKIFGDFSKLEKGLEVVDVGCGTGEQDLFFLDHFQCKRIVGLNISSSQIKIAKEKIKNKKKFFKKIKFHVEDALNLKKKTAGIYDRVIALECAQYLSKKQFVQGAAKVLKKGGYLCIADPFFKLPYSFDETNPPSLLTRIQDQYFRDKYGSKMEAKTNFFLKNFTQPIQTALKEIHLSHEEMLDILSKEGFQVDEIQEVSDHINQFYPTFEKEILRNLRTSNLEESQIDLCFTFLAQSCIHYSAYLQGEAKYFFIRAKKL